MSVVNRVSKLFQVQYPIVSGGMVYCSGWRLASAVSNAGGLGLLGSGSMSHELFVRQLQQCKQATDKPFGVNVVINRDVSAYMKTIIEEKVPIVFTSAGSPKVYTKELQKHGITVVHVVPSLKLALKCQAEGVDAVVVEGTEAGGHNGLEEITTMCLVPNVRAHLDPAIPVIAAGGIGHGRAMAAAIALGAEGVQVGTRFAVTQESSMADKTKELLTHAKEGDTVLTIKQIGPTRMYLNEFGKKMHQMSVANASKEEMAAAYGKHNTRRGMLEGEVVDGEIEIGQVVAQCEGAIPTAAEVVKGMVSEYNEAIDSLSRQKL
ncbi:enoyl-[acyl carrier protein] reductase II [Angomonas deanei]|uniref:IMP dehydrogenase / GMP reductase domain/Nitronate monooxygenase/Dihydroorotate dehydrogenase/FMN-dependent dehydrogenase, putative n=1 Tax=Angomonas deanei TaxID=59799 RepID=S9VJM5_9TRYP|nr:enoyl-[acyl carrier protein] reductase II [Angomonas deanei]EPY41034.1 enoyl-[acyl carrier protein] reductase II [Angomonas deanei]CAD2216918.1 IMP dehydrogenase / GMP reductase domain/Nitronate monooxygenase/Dihydroorotate dehydrogenase/FMN-dependent dehydrogenase, putative [Angomonas deanei]|eukprot:EPY31651.1 enoyl-[acyl carrier protein] reductase II [Angomonas deanei]